MCYVFAVIFLTGTEAISCSTDSDAKVCHITIQDNSTGGVSIYLESSREILKCIYCNTYTLPEIECEKSSLVKKIDFSGSRITTLQNTQVRYSSFTNVRVFNLSFNEIDQMLFLNDVLPISFTNLKTLDLSYNKIEIVYALNGLDRLSMKMTVLNLSYNKIVSFESECFKTKSKLRTLNLNNNRIPMLSASVYKYFNNISNLDLSFNDIAYIEVKVFENLTSLHILKLNNNKLTAVPETIGKLVSLQELYLSDNLFTRLDFLEYFLNPLSKLKRIGISDTDLLSLTLVERFNACGIVLELNLQTKRNGYYVEKRIGQKWQPNDTQCVMDDTISWIAILIAIGIMAVNIILLVISIFVLCKHHREFRY